MLTGSTQKYTLQPKFLMGTLSTTK